MFASAGERASVADGSTIDAEGCLWNARMIAGDLVRDAPDGTVERRTSTLTRPRGAIFIPDKIRLGSVPGIDHGRVARA